MSAIDRHSSAWNDNPPSAPGLNSPGFHSRNLRLTGLACLYVMAAMALWSVALVQLAETILLVVASIIAFRTRHTVVKQPLFWLTAFFIAYVVIRGWIASMERPDLYYQHWESVRRWIKAGLLPVLVVSLFLWATGREEKHNSGLLLVALAGLTAMLLVNAEWSKLFAAVQGQGRYTFDLHVAFSSLLFTVTFLGTVVYFPRIVRSAAPGGLPGRIAAGIAWGTLSLFYLTALVASGTRASWLAGLVGLFTIGIVGFKLRLWRPSRRTAFVTALGLAVLVVAGSIAYGPRIASRWQAEAGTIREALELPGDKDLHDLPKTSLSIRIAYNSFGLEQLSQRPIFGYGPAEPRYLRYEREIPHQLENRNDHFHSQYVDTLLRFGIVGFLPLLSLFILALLGVRRGWQTGRLSPSTGLFIVGFIAIYAVWSLADQRFTNFTMVAIVSVIVGIACSHLFPDDGTLPVTNNQSFSSATARQS